MSKIINNFWKGDISLWKSYWIIGELMNGIVILLILNIEIRFFNNNISNNIFSLLYFYNFHFINKIILIAWTLFITVGIWRAAEKYKGNIIWIILTLIFLSYRIFTLRVIFF
tara:strand:+ start:174 stop:509 length:336 start_codon:yes stop_codon:yes gene_type:complete